MQIIINERQEEILKKMMLKEAVGFGFSIEYMRQLTSFKKRYEYCKQFLGNPIGRGSSRIIFQYNDSWVIKLALNNKGLAQNEEEYQFCNNYDIDVTPKIYNELCDTKNFEFIVMEYVLPAKEEDFEHCYGFDFHTFCQILATVYNMRNPRNKLPQWKYRQLSDNDMEALYYDNEDLKAFSWYWDNYDLGGIGDLLRLSSYGITNRNGDLEIVILDSGLSDEIYNKFYSGKNKIK